MVYSEIYSTVLNDDYKYDQPPPVPAKYQGNTGGSKTKPNSYERDINLYERPNNSYERGKKINTKQGSFDNDRQQTPEVLNSLMKQMSVDEFEYGEERLDLSPLSQKHSDYDDDYDQDRYNSYYKNDCRDSYRNELPQNQMIVKADSRIRSDQRSIPRDNFARQDSYSSRKSPQRQNSGRYNSYSRSPLSPALTPSNSISMMRTNTCGGCKRPITDLSRGFEIEVLGTWFHDTCFRCEKCDVVFDERNPFVPWNGGVLCEPDFEEMTTCAACLQPIEDDKISYAFNRAFHSRHLRCHICKERIRGPHVEYNGKAFCQDDYDRLINSPCLKCNLLIKDEAVHAAGGTWHKSCFGCTTCNRPFTDKKFYVLDGLPFCLEHYHQANNTSCGRCMNPIEGPCVDIQELRMKFHPSCWRCSKCNDILDGVYYSYKGRQYCERDVEGVYEGKRPEKRHTFMGQQGVGARPPMPRPPMPMGRPIQGGGRPFQGGGRPIQGGGRPGISNGRM